MNNKTKYVLKKVVQYKVEKTGILKFQRKWKEHN